MTVPAHRDAQGHSMMVRTAPTPAVQADPGEHVVDLASRNAAGIEVSLLWRRATNTVSVYAVDEREGTAVEFVVDACDAMDAFWHPFAYAPASSKDDTPPE